MVADPVARFLDLRVPGPDVVERPVVPERAYRHDMRRAVGIDCREPRRVPSRTTCVSGACVIPLSRWSRTRSHGSVKRCHR